MASGTTYLGKRTFQKSFVRVRSGPKPLRPEVAPSFGDPAVASGSVVELLVALLDFLAAFDERLFSSAASRPLLETMQNHTIGRMADVDMQTRRTFFQSPLKAFISPINSGAPKRTEEPVGATLLVFVPFTVARCNGCLT